MGVRLGVRVVGRQRIARGVAVASLAAAVALVALHSSDRFSEELRADELLQGGARLQLLDQVTKMVGYAPSGISYGEGQMPLGLGAASGICDHGYCPQEGEGVEINPREVPTSPFAVRWDGFNWQSMDDDVNVYQPTDCLAKHLAGDESSCCEKDTEPCDGWGDGRHPHPENRPYPIPPPVPKIKAKPRPPRGKEVPAPGWSPHPYNVPYIRENAAAPLPPAEETAPPAAAEPEALPEPPSEETAPPAEAEAEPEALPEPEPEALPEPEGEIPGPEVQGGKGDYPFDDFSYESYPGEWEGEGGLGGGDGGEHSDTWSYEGGEGGEYGFGDSEHHFVHDVSYEGGEGGEYGFGDSEHHFVRGEHHSYTDSGGEMPEGAFEEDYSFSDPGHPGPKGSWSAPLEHAEKALTQQALGARRGRQSGAVLSSSSSQANAEKPR